MSSSRPARPPLRRLRRLLPVTLSVRLVVVVVIPGAVGGGVLAIATALAANSILVGQRDSTPADSLRREQARTVLVNGVILCPLSINDYPARGPGTPPIGQFPGSVVMRAGCA